MVSHSTEFDTFVKNVIYKNCDQFIRQAKSAQLYVVTSTFILADLICKLYFYQNSAIMNLRICTVYSLQKSVWKIRDLSIGFH